MATDKLFYQYSIQFPASLLRFLGIEDYGACKAGSISLKQPERRPDIVFEHKENNRRVVFLEFQGYLDPWIYYRLLNGVINYCQQREFFGELLPFIIFLEEDHRKGVHKVALDFDGKSHLAFEPEIVVLEKTQIEQLQALNDLSLVPLFPLCDINENQIKQKAPDWASRINQAREISVETKTNLLALLGGFIVHRIRELNLNDINNMLGGFKMEDTQVGKDLIEIGIEKGKHQIILRQLFHKFGTIPEDVKNRITSITNAKELNNLAIKTIDLSSLEELKKILN